jgi:CzcA family heavy metal efflux pump
VIILAVVLMFFGIVQLADMPVDVFPEFNPPLVEVQTEALGLSATEVEALLTVPMEADLLNGVAWLEHIYSDSVAGLSSILMIFEPGTDPIRARQMVQERLTEAFALPNVSTPPTMMQPLSTTSRAMMVSLSSDDLSLIDMGTLARWNIAPRLTGVPGVANVAIWGLREWQLQVLVDPEDLQEKGVSLNQIIETTGEALWVSPLSYLESSSPGTAGWIDTPNQRLSIRHELPITSAEDLAKLPVVGTAYILGDVSEVVEDHQPLIGDAVLKDGPGLLLVIEKFPNANTLEVTRGVEDALEAMKPGLTGIDIDTTVFRLANYIELATGNLTTVLIIGAVLLLLVLIVFYWDWRPTLVSLVAIPVSFVTALLVLYLFGSTLNVMLLAGLVVAIGIIVDDAIIDPENIRRRLRMHGGEMDSETKENIIVDAAAEMRSPIVFAILILLLVLLPVFLIQGISGAFFQPFTFAYILAMLIAMLVALTVTPSLSMVLLANHERRQSPLVNWLERGYRGILAATIKAPKLAYISAGVIVVLSLVALPFLNLSLMPTFKQTDLRIQWDAAPGTSRPEMNRIVTQVTGELQSIPGVRNIGAQVGRAITGDQISGINSGEIWVSLDPTAEYDATVIAIQEVVGGYPGLFREVENYQPDRIGQVVAGAQGNDIVVRIYGYQYDVLASKAQDVEAALSNIAGVVDLQVEHLQVEPQVEIEVDLAAAERYQLKPGDVRRSTTTLLSGLRVGNLYEEQKVFDVVVWGEPDVRENLTDLENLLIDTPGGGHVRLGEVAEIRIAPSPINIKRDAVSRYIDVTANVEGRSYGAVVADIDSSLDGIDFPLEYHAELLGDFAQQQASQQRTLLFAAVAAIGIILLLQASFWSWHLAIAAFVTILASLTGGVLAALLGGGVISLGSLFGFLAVLAISIRYSVVLTKHLQNLEQQEGVEFGLELVLRGAGERLRPILITAFATAVAVLPLAVAGAIPGLEILHPMAVVILGGLVTTTLLNLIVLPALYLRYGMKTEIIETPSPEPVAVS